MPTTIKATPPQLKQPYQFTTFQQFVNDLYKGIFELPKDLALFNFGDTVPAVENRNRPWIRTVSGAPVWPSTWVFHNGLWVSRHPIPQLSNYRTLWVGTEAAVWAFDDGDGGDPSITPPTQTAGAMWEVDHEYDGHSPIGPGTLQPSERQIAVKEKLGVDQITQTIEQIPQHAHFLAHDAGPGKPSRDFTYGASRSLAVAGDGGGDDEQYRLQTFDAKDKPALVITSSNTGEGRVMLTLSPVRGTFIIKRTAREFYRAP